jgi:hypothetical protein
MREAVQIIAAATSSTQAYLDLSFGMIDLITESEVTE